MFKELKQENDMKLPHRALPSPALSPHPTVPIGQAAGRE